MARARNIKPAFFKNELLAELEPLDRLLFIGLWCLADREGRLEDRHKRIKMELFPCDSYDVNGGLAALQAAGFVTRYSVAGKSVVSIVNFHKHQTPHGTEKDSELPDENGELTVHERTDSGYTTGKKRANNVKKGADNVDPPLGTGEEPVNSPGHNALNPESRILNPDSLKKDAGEPAAEPDKPTRPSRGEKTLKTYLAECKEAGAKPVPDDHYVRRYCRDAGITDDMAAIAWLRFREDHTVGTRKAKRYSDWPAAFANSVKDRWYRLWLVNPEGEANWTNEGLQALRVVEARQREAEVEA